MFFRLGPSPGKIPPEKDASFPVQKGNAAAPPAAARSAYKAPRSGKRCGPGKNWQYCTVFETFPFNIFLSTFSVIHNFDTIDLYTIPVKTMMKGEDAQMLQILRSFTRILAQGCDVLNNADVRNVQKINY